MPELLVEVGCEELPAVAVQRAVADLASGLGKLIAEAGLRGSAEPTLLATPRRLIVCFHDLLERQADVVKEQRGPALKAAFDASGTPTQALLGFCRSNGISVDDLRRDDQYVWVDKKVAGRPAGEILATLIPQAIRALTFDKTMRWGSSRLRFARPIRWLLAVLDGSVVGFDIEGVASGNLSRGHRFYAPEAFEVSSLKTLTEGLRARKVEPDPAVRRDLIVKGAEKAAQGTPQMSDALIDENVQLTEWPTAIEGVFKPDYLELPEPVLVTAMAKHERMFPVRGADGKLVNRFVFVRNAGEDATVRKGSEWVLNARFNDAKFFFDEDHKSSLDDFLAKTSGIVFAEKLGTVRQRADRLAALAEGIAGASGADRDEEVLARQAGLYAKADLSTGLVSDMASLQGVIGGEYARREGILDEVCWAIASQYDLSKNSLVENAKARTAVRLVMADQLDKLAGYLGIGLAPTGSSDPFGLRRAVTLLIEAAWSWPGVLPPFADLLKLALAEYKAQGFELDEIGAQNLMAEIFAARYSAMMPHVRYDILDAAILKDLVSEVTSPQRVKLRSIILEGFVGHKEFIQTATRPINIVSSARKKAIPFAEVDPLRSLDLAALDSTEGAGLYTVLLAQQDALESAVRAGNGIEVVKLVQNLADPIVKFFDTTMVMAEEEDIRFARLSLMQATALQLLAAGDFSKLEGE